MCNGRGRAQKGEHVPTTHLGVPASDFVLLESIEVIDSPDPRQSLAFFRTLPADGTMDPSSGTFGYTAPTNKALVITEIDWQYEAGVHNGNVTLRMFLTWPGPGPGIDRRVLESTILLGASGGGGTSTAETTGVIVPHGVKITVDVIGSGSTGKLQHVLMRGYITDFSLKVGARRTGKHLTAAA
jgi:hypothetical protein